MPTIISQRVLTQLEVKEAKAKKWQNIMLAGGIALIVLVDLVMSWILLPEMAKSLQVISSFLPIIAAAVLLYFGMKLFDQKVIWAKGEDIILE